MKNLIVSADDFGLARSINEGIVKALKEGIVTSLHLLPAGNSFEDSLYLLKGAGLKEISAHLSLTATRPITAADKIPTLVNRNGYFRNNYISFFRDLFLDKIRHEEIRLELDNQLARLSRMGLPIMCLSSHEHIHMMPSLLEIFLGLAEKYKIPFIRYPHDDPVVRPLSLKKIFKLCLLSSFQGSMGAAIKRSGLRTADNFMGFFDSGNMREEILMRLLGRLKEGTTELVCHPGFLGPDILEKCVFQLNCEGEVFALVSRRVKSLIAKKGINLVGFSALLVRK
jgi:chitin disaccharide deacetylase